MKKTLDILIHETREYPKPGYVHIALRLSPTAPAGITFSNGKLLIEEGISSPSEDELKKLRKIFREGQIEFIKNLATEHNLGTDWVARTASVTKVITGKAK